MSAPGSPNAQHSHTLTPGHPKHQPTYAISSTTAYISGRTQETWLAVSNDQHGDRERVELKVTMIATPIRGQEPHQRRIFQRAGGWLNSKEVPSTNVPHMEAFHAIEQHLRDEGDYDGFKYRP